MTGHLKIQFAFLSSRDKFGNPTIWGDHVLTWRQTTPGVWFMIDMKEAGNGLR